MREVVYYVATTVDGFIAREDGSFEDFPWDEDYLAALMDLYPETFPAPMRPQATRDENRTFQAVLMGRRTYDVGLAEGLTSPYPTLDQYVVSTTLRASPDPQVELVSSDPVDFTRRLKAEPGGSIWLCGGGQLASTLFSAGVVDRLVLKVNPLVLGAGIPLLGAAARTQRLILESHRRFVSGHLLLSYVVAGTERGS